MIVVFHLLYFLRIPIHLKYSKRNKSPKTVERERYVLKSFKAFLHDDIAIQKITTNTIERYINNRLHHDIHLSTASIELRVLKAVFNKAIELGYIDTNPVKNIKLPKFEDVTVRFLRIGEVEKLMRVIVEDENIAFANLVSAYLHTGARRNELLPPLFTWDNINFEEKRIRINGMKRQSRRYIPMSNTLLNILDDIHKMDKEYPFNYKPDFVTHKIAKYYKEVNIIGANLHSLRKTFGSLLIQNKKADIYTVSKLLGHASVKTTEKYYVDLIGDNYKVAIEGLDEII